jgi:predicted O-methyltransferase YrrM
MPEFNVSREWLAFLFRIHGFMNGAEVGVERGHFSKVLCEAMPSGMLYAVDAWQAMPGYREHVSQSKLEAFYAETVERLKPYSAKVIRGLSVEVAKQFEDRSLDFVYIDAQHDYANVKADIAAWEPKVRLGGILSGHDYVRRKRMNFGVKEAVNEWAKAHGRDLIILRGDKSPSWMWEVR